VYYSGNQWFERYLLADVKSGRAHVVVSAETLKQHDPGPGYSTVLFALEVPNVGWYGPSEVVNAQEVSRAIDALGVTRVAGGIHAIELPSSVSQTLRLENPDGTPRPNQDVTLWAFETAIGHCALEVGIGPIPLVTDARGVARFRSPVRELFLSATYFDPQTREEKHGESLSAGREHVFRQQWEQRKEPERAIVVHVLGRDAKPARAEVFVEGPWDFAGCSQPTRSLGKTNAEGVVSASISFDDVWGIWIGEDGYDDQMRLTDQELNQLRRTGEISLVWPRPAPR